MSESSSTPLVKLSTESSTALRVILPVIYSLSALIGLIGNLIVLQIICANRFRHKSIHLLVCSLLFADTFYVIIFTIVRAVSYGYLSTAWFINVTDWCKAEMYLLRLFEYVLAYTIVFLCLDRSVRPTSCWSGVRKLRSGISIIISIWLVSAYVLIPILLFNQTIRSQQYGGYLCQTTDQSVPLYWLGAYPRRILDFIDIVFRVYFPLALMIFILFIGLINCCCFGEKDARSNTSLLTSTTLTSVKNFDQLVRDDVSLSLPSYNRRLFVMVVVYVVVFAFCQLPYELYRTIMLWDQTLERNLQADNLDFAIEIPLLILKLINHCINPFLYMCLADIYALRRKCCRLWCVPCLPCCIGCNQCWLYDCWRSCKYELNHCRNNGRGGGGGDGSDGIDDDQYVPTGLQTISTYQYRDGDRLVTKQRILEEYETGVEPFYKNPKMYEKLQHNSLARGPSGGHVNDTFEHDDPNHMRISTIKLNVKPNASAPEEHLRIKL